MNLSFNTRWRDELPGFYTSLQPTPLSNARVIWHNAPLAQELTIPESLFSPPQGAGVWGGETLLPGMSPLAQVYSGHQFGAWAGQLGDGRGILLGEQQLENGKTLDWHLKVAQFCVPRYAKAWLLRRCTIWGSPALVRWLSLLAIRRSTVRRWNLVLC